jgi:uncharacterized membrane protein
MASVTRWRGESAGCARGNLHTRAQAKLAGATPACPVSGCETVLTSSYSEIFGVPLSLLGMLAYGAVAAAAVIGLLRSKQGNPVPELLNTGIAAGSTLLAGVSGLLMCVQRVDQWLCQHTSTSCAHLHIMCISPGSHGLRGHSSASLSVSPRAAAAF